MWYVFAGMGTQWFGMGRRLIELEAFKKSILKSDAYLQKHGVKLYDTLMNGDDNMFEDTIYSFVGIAGIQACYIQITIPLM